MRFMVQRVRTIYNLIYLIFGRVSLEHGLVLALSDTDFSLLTVGQLTIAVIRDSIQGTYHVFDSHSRDAFGNPSENGASVLLSFTTLAELCIYIQRTYVNQLINLTPVLITDKLQPSFEFAPRVNPSICTCSSNNCVCPMNVSQMNQSYSRPLGDTSDRHSHDRNVSNPFDNECSGNCVQEEVVPTRDCLGQDNRNTELEYPINEEYVDISFVQNHTYSQGNSEVDCNLGSLHDHTYSLYNKHEDKESNCMVTGTDTEVLTNERRLNDTINFQQITSLPGHFRFLDTDDRSHLCISNRGDQDSTEMATCE